MIDCLTGAGGALLPNLSMRTSHENQRCFAKVRRLVTTTPRTIALQEMGIVMKIYQEKIAPPGPLPVLASKPSDVLLSQRTIESREQENAWLKERLTRIIRSQIAK